MIEPRPPSARWVLGCCAGVLCAVAVACDDDGKSAPPACSDPPLELFDVAAGAPASPGDQVNPCVTPVGDAYSPPPQFGGSSSGGSGTSDGGEISGSGSDTGGAPNLGGSPSEAGAAGAGTPLGGASTEGGAFGVGGAAAAGGS